ncbi:hypothetical protein GBAR_LOCUS21120 [Geodia barretti]|uniref:Uncharacterized protein n=1 Tax=Geodia barretti TaxID=519541 RepID=A0AA35SY03_GEOBA|nr:hypothetical protein GBAR_LOCUS21120 [Geodia barretti]
MENQPVQANAQPMSYSIVFSPDKPQVPVPKCVTEYKSKPADSPGTLQRRLDDATERRKEEEQARLARIQLRDKAVTGFDKMVRPYIDSLQQQEEEEATCSRRD